MVVWNGGGVGREWAEVVCVVVKGVIGRKSYTVRDMNGVDFFIVERKSLHNWSRRVISDKGGTPICFIDHVPNKSGTVSPQMCREILVIRCWWCATFSLI